MSKKIDLSFIENYKNRMETTYTSYIDDILNRTKSKSNFIKINKLEEKLITAKKINSEIYNDVTSTILININEDELIDSKKKNISKKEYT